MAKIKVPPESCVGAPATIFRKPRRNSSTSALHNGSLYKRTQTKGLQNKTRERIWKTNFLIYSLSTHLVFFRNINELYRLLIMYYRSRYN